jgi:flagellar hook-associated protein 3 FlgL
MVRQIEKLASQQARLQQQVATGQRIFQAEDDPSAVRRALQIETEQREIAQFARNASYAGEVSQATYSGLQQIKKVSDRATEIGTLGSGMLSPAGAQAYAEEVNQLIEQALQLGNTSFRGDYLYAGTAVDAPPFGITRNAAGQIATIDYNGNADQAAIPLSSNGSIAPGTSGATNVGLRDFLRQLVDLRDALRTNNAAGVDTAQTALLASEDNLISALADHGGVQLRIEIAETQQRNRADNLEQLLSGETDADLPTTIVKLNEAQTAYQAALQSAANIMRVSLLDYIR